jgi:hypothetical protein
MYSLNKVVTGNNKLRYKSHKHNTFMLTLYASRKKDTAVT